MRMIIVKGFDYLLIYIIKLLGKKFFDGASDLNVEAQHAGMRLEGWLGDVNYQRSQNDGVWIHHFDRDLLPRVGSAAPFGRSFLCDDPRRGAKRDRVRATGCVVHPHLPGRLNRSPNDCFSGNAAHRSTSPQSRKQLEATGD